MKGVFLDSFMNFINSKKKIDSLVLCLGIFLINTLFFSLAITTLLFFVKVSISPINLVLTFIISFFTSYFLTKNFKYTLISTFIGIFIISFLTVVCMHSYDWSWDGNTYHKCIAGFLKYGWNPLYETFFSFRQKNLPIFESCRASWYDAYPKASEIFAACIYSICGDIEGGKSFNVVSLVALFCICYEFLVQTKKLKNWQTFLCALFCVLNPISLKYCLLYYVDSYLYQMILLCFVSLLYLTFYGNGKYKYLSAYFIFVSINIGFNIKYSGLLFFAILCLSFFIFWCVGKIRQGGFSPQNKRYVFNRFYLFAISVISGLMFSGASCYLRNTFKYKNPLYIMIGEGKVQNLVSAQIPNSIETKPYFVQVVASLFSKVNNIKNTNIIAWKIPFLFNSEEYNEDFVGFDTRMAGWGILFGGIFLISIAIIIWGLKKYGKQNKRLTKLAVTLLCVLIFSVCVVQGMWWARYNMFFFLIPVAALFFLFWNTNNNHSETSSYFAGCISVLLLINMVPPFYKVGKELGNFSKAQDQVKKVAKLLPKNDIAIGFNPRYSFMGRIFSLYDAGIKDFAFVGEMPREEQDGILFHNNIYGVCYKILSGPLSARTPSDFFEQIKNGDYLTLISVKDEGSKSLTEDFIETVQSLGLEFPLKDAYRFSYLAVLDRNNVLYEDKSEKELTYSKNIDGLDISMISAGFEAGNRASIKVDGVEYSLNNRGINVVLFDKKQKKLIAKVSIDSFLDNKFTKVW